MAEQGSVCERSTLVLIVSFSFEGIFFSLEFWTEQFPSDLHPRIRETGRRSLPTELIIVLMGFWCRH